MIFLPNKKVSGEVESRAYWAQARKDKKGKSREKNLILEEQGNTRQCKGSGNEVVTKSQVKKYWVELTDFLFFVCQISIQEKIIIRK